MRHYRARSRIQTNAQSNIVRYGSLPHSSYSFAPSAGRASRNAIQPNIHGKAYRYSSTAIWLPENSEFLNEFVFGMSQVLENRDFLTLETKRLRYRKLARQKFFLEFFDTRKLSAPGKTEKGPRLPLRGPPMLTVKLLGAPLCVSGSIYIMNLNAAQ